MDQSLFILYLRIRSNERQLCLLQVILDEVLVFICAIYELRFSVDCCSLKKGTS